MSLEVSAAPLNPATAIEFHATRPSAPAASTSLLPAPRASGLDATQDAMSMLYKLLGHQQTLTMKIGEAQVTTANHEQLTAIAQQRHELLQQLKEASESGFWHDLLSVCETIAKVAGMVVSLAAGAVAAIFTGGATLIAAVAVAAVLVSGGLVVSATHCFGDASNWIALGAEIVASVLTLGATSGSAVSGAASQAAQTVDSVSHGVSSVAQGVEGTATIVAGVGGLETAKYGSEAEDTAADMQQSMNQIQKQTELVESIVTGLKDSEKSNENALRLVADAAGTYGHLLTLATSGRA